MLTFYLTKTLCMVKWMLNTTSFTTQCFVYLVSRARPIFSFIWGLSQYKKKKSSLAHKTYRLLRSRPSTTSVLRDESWCISEVNSCRSWLTNHRRFNFTTRNVQTLKLLLTRFVTCLQMKFLLLITCLQKYLYIPMDLLNRPNQLIRQCFLRQLVRISVICQYFTPPKFSHVQYILIW